MRRKLRHFLSAALILAALPAPSSFAGPESGGGGGTVTINDKPVLIDFFTLSMHPQEAESFFNRNSPSRIAEETLEPFQFVRDQKIEDPAFNLAWLLIDEWAQVPLDIIATRIQGAFLKPLKWQFTNEALVAPSFYRAPRLPADLAITPAAFYNPLNLGTVRLHLPVWNLLSAFDQVGLVIHETLRQMQLLQGFGFDDEILQKATTIVVTCKPSVKADQYLTLLILNRPQVARARLGDFDSLTSACEKRK